MQESRRHGAFACVRQTNTTVRAFAVRDRSCEDHPTCKRVRDCERGMRPNVEASTRRDRAERERVLFIGTQFSILYTSMYSQAEAATR